MANASLMIDNLALSGSVGASSQVLTMPASNLLTPHPSERWRSLVNSAWFVLDKGAAEPADTVMVCGLTCGPNAMVRLRLSTIDLTGAAGDVLDSGAIASGTLNFDVLYGSFVWQLPSPAAWRYVRFDISDPDADFVEAGCIADGLAESFSVNFSNSGSVQHVDRSRVSPTASGMTLTWKDNTFRRIDLSFDSVSWAQRFGVVERLDRVMGVTENVLLIIDPASLNLPRDSIFGLVTSQTPIAFAQAYDSTGKPLFGKEIRMDERI
jgi:hypothetical protein